MMPDSPFAKWFENTGIPLLLMLFGGLTALFAIIAIIGFATLTYRIVLGAC